MQGTVLFGFAHWYLYQVEPVVHLEHGLYPVAELVLRYAGFQSVERGLRVAQGNVHFRHLQNLRGVIRAHTQGGAAVHDVLAQAHCQGNGTLLGLLVAYGVVVYGACHARHVGIEARAVLLAHHFLQDNRHLLLVDYVGRGSHVVLASTEIHRGIHTLDGVSKHFQTAILVLVVGNHVG